ncbi:hypothetical protein [Lacrimispora amygdalina]|uniref:hypothetical protein n=1 Tax=Lacrimispora amygdalina TaxID=253257 RepID=UPI000BE2E768|nr:hypothetical protein [Lacrimispora amygdalina]
MAVIKKKLSDYNTETLFMLSPMDLTEILWSEYNFIIPFNEETISINDMIVVQELITKTGNAFSYLAYLNSIAKIKVRQAKRSKEMKKEDIEDAIDRKDAISNIAEAVKMQYSAISRLITVKQQINEELKMTDGR